MEVKTISTHAPAGGATGSLGARCSSLIISTHAPAGGATKIVIVYGRGKSFLLTPLREGRRM